MIYVQYVLFLVASVMFDSLWPHVYDSKNIFWGQKDLFLIPYIEILDMAVIIVESHNFSIVSSSIK